MQPINKLTPAGLSVFCGMADGLALTPVPRTPKLGA